MRGLKLSPIPNKRVRDVTHLRPNFSGKRFISRDNAIRDDMVTWDANRRAATCGRRWGVGAFLYSHLPQRRTISAHTSTDAMSTAPDPKVQYATNDSYELPVLQLTQSQRSAEQAEKRAHVCPSYSPQSSDFRSVQALGPRISSAPFLSSFCPAG